MASEARHGRLSIRQLPAPIDPWFCVPVASAHPHPGLAAGSWDVEREEHELQYFYESCPCCEHAPCVWCGHMTMVEHGPICGVCEHNIMTSRPYHYDDAVEEPWLSMKLHLDNL